MKKIMDKIKEKCFVCGKEHEQAVPPLAFGGMKIGVCPELPKDYLIKKSDLDKFGQMQAEMDKKYPMDEKFKRMIDKKLAVKEIDSDCKEA